MAHHKIHRVEIEPADKGGFTVHIHHKAHVGKDGTHTFPEPKHIIAAHHKALGNMISDMFAPGQASQAGGTSTDQSAGGSQLSTYTGGPDQEME